MKNINGALLYLGLRCTILFTLLTCVEHAYANQCMQVFTADATAEFYSVEQQAWRNQLSSAWNHKASDFRYLVHGLHRGRVKIDPNEHNGVEQGWIRTLSSAHTDITESNKLYNISASLIDPAFTKTWGKLGFILNVPERNLIAATSEDMITYNTIDSLLKDLPGGNPTERMSKYREEVRDRHGLISPEELLRQSKANNPPIINEVLIAQTLPGSQVTIAGVFVQADASDEVKEAAHQYASRNYLPLVILGAK